jgi:hypothetical protein
MDPAEFAAAAMRRVFRWRTAVSRAAGAVMFVSEAADRRASCTDRFYTRIAAPHSSIRG